MRRIPAQPITVRDRVVRVDHELHVLGQLCLLGQKVLRMRVEIRRGPGI